MDKRHIDEENTKLIGHTGVSIDDSVIEQGKRLKKRKWIIIGLIISALLAILVLVLVLTLKVSKSKPEQLGPASTENSGASVIVKWAASPNTHNSDVTSYRITFRTLDDTYQTTSSCDGTDPTIVSNLSCTVPMNVLTSPPFNLTVGKVITAVVVAVNGEGQSTQSIGNSIGATAFTVPSSSPSPRRAFSSYQTQIQMSWDALTPGSQDGGSPVLGYTIYWDQGNGTWVAPPPSASLSLSSNGAIFFTQNPVTARGSYQYQVSVSNLYGEGPRSPACTVVAATQPSSPGTPKTILLNDNTEFQIDWAASSSDGGSNIISYDVIVVKDGGWQGVLKCKEPSATVLNQQRCTIDVSTLYAAPWSWTSGSYFQVIVKATNLLATDILGTNIYGSSYSNVGGQAVLP